MEEVPEKNLNEWQYFIIVLASNQGIWCVRHIKLDISKILLY